MQFLSIVLILLWTAAPGVLAQGQRQQQSMNQMFQRDNARIQDVEPRVGEALPDVIGFDEQKQPFNLKDMKGSYAVIVSGCLT